MWMFWTISKLCSWNSQSVKEINLYVLCNKKRLRCASYLGKCVVGKECTFKSRTDNYFVLTSGNKEVL
jgi:hypothetical protein